MREFFKGWRRNTGTEPSVSSRVQTFAIGSLLELASKFVVVLIISLAAGISFAETGEDDVSAILEQLSKFKDIRHSHKLYRSLFAKAGIDGLSRFQSLDDDSIAIQAAWETVRLTVPVENGKEVYRPDHDKLVWFLGFVHGRIRCMPPEWWREAILDSRANRRKNIYGGDPTSSPYHRSGINDVNCPKDASVEELGNSVIYKVAEESIKIPEEILVRSDAGNLVCDISGSFTDKHCFLAIHDDVGFPHKVACIDRTTGKLVWESTACGCWVGGATGVGKSWVSVVHSGGSVFVFGQSSIGFYFHVFRALDGETLIHFSNYY